MKPSKLEEYITILQILQIHGPIQLTEIESLVRLERTELRKDLSFLLQQNVVKRDPSETETAYAASPLYARLVKYFCSNALINKQPQ